MRNLVSPLFYHKKIALAVACTVNAYQQSNFLQIYLTIYYFDKIVQVTFLRDPILLKIPFDFRFLIA